MQASFSRQCQSCSMPLKNGELSGSEKDGSKSLEYCALCYKHGAFCDPQMTLPQMKKIVDSALRERGWIAPLRWLAIWQLPSLKRWK